MTLRSESGIEKFNAQKEVPSDSAENACAAPWTFSTGRLRRLANYEASSEKIPKLKIIFFLNDNINKSRLLFTFSLVGS